MERLKIKRNINKETLISKLENKIFIYGLLSIAVALILFIVILVVMYTAIALSPLQWVVAAVSIATLVIIMSIVIYLFELNYEHLHKVLKHTRNKVRGN